MNHINILKYVINFSGENFPVADLFTSDPYLKIYSLNDKNFGKKGVEGYKLVYQSEFIKSNLNPEWKTVRLEFNEKQNTWKFVEC